MCMRYMLWRWAGRRNLYPLCRIRSHSMDVKCPMQVGAVCTTGCTNVSNDVAGRDLLTFPGCGLRHVHVD